MGRKSLKQVEQELLLMIESAHKSLKAAAELAEWFPGHLRDHVRWASSLRVARGSLVVLADDLRSIEQAKRKAADGGTDPPLHPFDDVLLDGELIADSEWSPLRRAA